jgi:hypothetical protein
VRPENASQKMLVTILLGVIYNAREIAGCSLRLPTRKTAPVAVTRQPQSRHCVTLLGNSGLVSLWGCPLPLRQISVQGGAG